MRQRAKVQEMLPKQNLVLVASSWQTCVLSFLQRQQSVWYLPLKYVKGTVRKGRETDGRSVTADVPFLAQSRPKAWGTDFALTHFFSVSLYATSSRGGSVYRTVAIPLF